MLPLHLLSIHSSVPPFPPHMNRANPSFFAGGASSHTIVLYVRILHPSTKPHLLDQILILNHQPSGLQDVLQCLHHALERRLGALFLGEACNGDIGAAATVEEGVEFGGYREGRDVEGCEKDSN